MGALEPGATLGGYSIIARLRAGGMGVLYLARRIGPAGFARPVAIKVIHDHLASNKRFVKMFIDEARLSARIDDPHVVRVEEFGELDGRYYIVMEYVHGASLSEALRVFHPRPAFPTEIAVAIAMQVASGLHGAHEATDEDGAALNIVHRDVSPGNILLSFGGHVRIIDFGVAKARIQGQGQTQTGSLRGKLAYMPPEQARSSKHVDRRADVYALGLVLWEMLVGKRMLDAPDDLSLLTLLKNPPVIPPSSHGADVPRELDDLVTRCLAVDPNERPQGAAELQRLLGDVYPAALRVIPSDIASVMAIIRKRASEMSGDDEEADTNPRMATSGVGTIFGRSMHESIVRSEEITPRQSLLDMGVPVEPSVIVTGHDEETGRYGSAPVLPPYNPNNPQPGVKPIPRPKPRAQQKTMLITTGSPKHPWLKNPLVIVGAVAAASMFIITAVVMVVIRSSERDRNAETRQLFERKVRRGGASVEEARAVYAACTEMGDKVCASDVASKYPQLLP